MTNLMDLITGGVVNRPQGIVCYGPQNTRKTGSFVSPKTLFVDLERGTDQYAVDRIHIDTYEQFIRTLDLIIHEKSTYEIIVVDPIEIAEKLLIGQTCKQLKIDGLAGMPHGAAWNYLRENFDREFLSRFDEIRRTGRHMVVVGHAQVRTVTLPGLAEAYDKWELRIDKQNAATLIEWADHVLFFDWDIRTAKNRDGVVRVLGGREPIIQLLPGPGWIAKNRVGLTEPLKTGFANLAPLFQSSATAAETPQTVQETAQPAPSVMTPATDREPPGAPLQVDAAPDKQPVEPLLTDEERKAVEAIFSALPQERLFHFLQVCDAIKDGQDWDAAGAAYLRRILANPEGFRNAVLAV
jgi:hypothetical protein